MEFSVHIGQYDIRGLGNRLYEGQSNQINPVTKYVWENTGNDFLRFIVIERCEYFIASRMSGSEENCGIGSTI